MNTAKANGLNLEKYLHHPLTVLPERLGKSETLRIEDLLPWTQEMQGVHWEDGGLFSGYL
ncbi:MAG: transposase domain-containing protein [Clostridia bacterium]